MSYILIWNGENSVFIPKSEKWPRGVKRGQKKFFHSGFRTTLIGLIHPQKLFSYNASWVNPIFNRKCPSHTVWEELLIFRNDFEVFEKIFGFRKDFWFSKRFLVIRISKKFFEMIFDFSNVKKIIRKDFELFEANYSNRIIPMFMHPQDRVYLLFYFYHWIVNRCVFMAFLDYKIKFILFIFYA